MAETPDWRQRLVAKALEDPEFFRSLLRNRDNPGPVVEETGISLSEEELEELQAVLTAERLEFDVDWSRVERMVGEADLEVLARWPNLIGWITPGGGWRP